MKIKTGGKVLIFGGIHFLLQWVTAFLGLALFLDTPIPPEGSVLYVTGGIAGTLNRVIFFPMAIISETCHIPPYPWDTSEKMAIGFLSNSIVWIGIFYFFLMGVSKIKPKKALGE